jgi:hypothetical protein
VDNDTRSASPTPAESQIAGLKWRLARAEADRDTWRAAGMQENYLGACSLVDGLNLQLDQLEATARLPATPSVALIAPTEPPAASTPARAGETSELSITSIGRQYGYRGYRYDRFTDAIDYARLDRSRAFADPGVDDALPLEHSTTPSESELALMRTLGISFTAGVFQWRQFRYERLADAVVYARREQALEARAGSRSLTLRRK